MSAHLPVLTDEVLHFLQPQRGGLFVDCTVGLGGHSRALLEAGATRIVGFDRDADALAIARETLAPWGDRVELVHADYRAFGGELDRRGIGTIDGALADLGVSSMQFDSEGRGFSFQRDEPLDMRMDRSTGEERRTSWRTPRSRNSPTRSFSMARNASRGDIAGTSSTHERDPLDDRASRQRSCGRPFRRGNAKRIDPATRVSGVRILVSRTRRARPVHQDRGATASVKVRASW